MIDTSNMLRQDRMDAYQDGRLTVYMEDVVWRLERLQKNESDGSPSVSRRFGTSNTSSTTSTWRTVRADSRRGSSSRRS